MGTVQFTKFSRSQVLLAIPFILFGVGTGERTLLTFPPV